MYQQLWGYKVEDKLYLGVRGQKWLNTTGLRVAWQAARICSPFELGAKAVGRNRTQGRAVRTNDGISR
jgi:hypothetical protein